MLIRSPFNQFLLIRRVMSLERTENGGTQHVTLYQDEVDYIVNSTLSKTLHKKLVSFSYHQCVAVIFLSLLFALIRIDVVTSIQGQSFYLRSVNTTEPSGMCLIRASDKHILIATYAPVSFNCYKSSRLRYKNSSNCVAGRAIPYIINQVVALINL
jgi:hypothetical protein